MSANATVPSCTAWTAAPAGAPISMPRDAGRPPPVAPNRCRTVARHGPVEIALERSDRQRRRRRRRANPVITACSRCCEVRSSPANCALRSRRSSISWISALCARDRALGVGARARGRGGQIAQRRLALLHAVARVCELRHACLVRGNALPVLAGQRRHHARGLRQLRTSDADSSRRAYLATTELVECDETRAQVRDRRAAPLPRGPPPARRSQRAPPWRAPGPCVPVPVRRCASPGRVRAARSSPSSVRFPAASLSASSCSACSRSAARGTALQRSLAVSGCAGRGRRPRRSCRTRRARQDSQRAGDCAFVCGEYNIASMRVLAVDVGRRRVGSGHQRRLGHARASPVDARVSAPTPSIRSPP